MAVNLHTPNHAHTAGMRGAAHPGKTGKQGNANSKGDKSSEKTSGEDGKGGEAEAASFASKVHVKGRRGSDGGGSGQGNPDGQPQTQSTKKAGKAGAVEGVAKAKPIVRSQAQSVQERRNASVTTKVAAPKEHRGGAVDLTKAHCEKFGVDRREQEMLPSAALSGRSTIKNPPFASRLLESITNLPKSLLGGLFGGGKTPVGIPATGRAEKAVAA